MNIMTVFDVALTSVKDWNPLTDTLSWMEDKGHVFEDESKSMYAKYKDKFDLFLHNLNTEKTETKEAFALLYHSVRDGKQLTSDEKTQVGNQMKDLLKTVGLIGFAALPGGSLFFLLAGILKWNKYIMPAAFLQPAPTKLRALIIGPDEKASIKKLMDYADGHPFEMDDLLDILSGHSGPPGDNPKFVCNIPDGFRVVYTVEHQPAGKIKHISISVDGKDNYPNTYAVEVLLKEFAFRETDVTKARTSIEKEVRAVNVVEIIEGVIKK